ncbi:MAG: hypothetical protein J6N70_14680 [Oribacterium sp.]|nr:hypothetical protein [Oribacterium sp.]
MNCYTRKEKWAMAIDDVMTKVKMAVEITIIVAGIIAFGAICFMNQRMTAMEKELNYYKENYVQEQETKLQIVDTVTGRVIYEE